MTAYLLYLRLPGAERFHGIHGDKISDAARTDLTRRFAALARDLLSQHRILSDPQSPVFGVWLAPFALSRLEFESGEAEQLESIVAAGRELARAALEEELGSAVALHSRFEVGTFEIEESARDSSEWMRRLDALPRAAEPPSAQASRDERAALLGIIARPVDIRLQAIVSLRTRTPVAFEALARGPAGSPLHDPDRLFEASARWGLRAELELACFDSALRLARSLPAGCRLAINLSPDQFAAPAVRRLAESPGLPERLILEITEHLPIPEPARLFDEMRLLRGKGAQIALDDAGCGYLNMELVRSLKPDIVKLCITVIRRIGAGPEILATIRETVAAIRAQGAEVLAEGVETETQARLARDCGCALAQGFLFEKPQTLSEVLAAAAATAGKTEHFVR